MRQVVGLDIGGANLKVATSSHGASSRSFPLWKNPEGLAAELAAMLAELPRPDIIAVTMTGELADCFTTKAEGVDRILQSVEEIAADARVLVWSLAGRFVAPEEAREAPLQVAASNWHALATFAGRFLPESRALLMDIGSTTTDIIPLHHGQPVPRGLTDCARLQSGELVYTGVRRTPLCALALSVPFRGSYCPVAAEFFASTLDVYLTLGAIPEDPADCDTANGRPATISAAHDRLARMLCCDSTEFDPSDAEALSRFYADVQKRRIQGALERVLATDAEPVEAALITGSGSFLARTLLLEHPRLTRLRLIELEELADGSISEAACAYAVAVLAEELPLAGR